MPLCPSSEQATPAGPSTKSALPGAGSGIRAGASGVSALPPRSRAIAASVGMSAAGIVLTVLGSWVAAVTGATSLRTFRPLGARSGPCVQVSSKSRYDPAQSAFVAAGFSPP